MANNQKRHNQSRTVASQRGWKKKLTTGQMVLLGIGIVIVLIIVLGVIGDNMPRNYYLKDVKILQCSIDLMEFYDGKNYIKVRPDDSTDSIYLSDDESWFEVNIEFYQNHTINSKIGVRLDNLDIYKRKFFGSGQTYEKNLWSINEVYESLADAQNANPVKKFTKEAKIVKKKITSKGDHFLVISSDQRSMPVMVDEIVYSKYQVNDSISCDFESISDLTRLIKVNE